jgi:LacI family transcriptional regulator
VLDLSLPPTLFPSHTLFLLDIIPNASYFWKPFHEMALPPTIYDIARAAKVGIGTVSRVFNDHPSVKDETRRRVLKIASRYNYHPHPFARGLARKRTNAILVYIPFYTSFFYAEILQSVQSALGEVGCDLILHGVKHPGQSGTSFGRAAVRGRVDGALFFSMKIPDEIVSEYQDSKVPLVLVDTHHEAFDSFFVENVRGAELVTEHLIHQGHRCIGMINATRESPPARDRLKGFRKALSSAGLELNSDWVLQAPPGTMDGFTKEAGYGMMKTLLRQKKKPSAVVIASDIQAVGALEAMKEMGLQNPGDIAITGFDDIELARHFGLTTMRQPMSEMGSLAANRLIERMADLKLPVIRRSFLPELIIRSTDSTPL